MGAARQGSTTVFPNRLRAWVALGLLGANLFVLALSAYSLHQSRQQHELRAQVQTQNLASAIDQNLSNSIDKIDLALRAIADHLEHELAEGGIDPHQTTAVLNRYQQRLLEVEAIRVANADGRVILGRGLDPQERVSWADRDYFIHLRDHADAGLQISKPRLGRVAKKYIVGFARRYNYPDGRFAGVVSAPVSLDYFSSLLSRFEVGRKGVVALRDADLGLIARYPPVSEGPASVVGNTVVSRELSELAGLGVGSATYHTRLAADGMERIITFRRLQGAPMIAIVGAAKEDYLAEWHSEVYRTAAWIVGFALLSALTTGLLLRLLSRIMRESQQSQCQQRALAESEARLRQSEERYRLLLNNSPVGILHFDRDLVVTYANARFGEIMQAPSEHMLGLDCTRLKDQRVVPPMRQALAGEHGHYEGPYVTTYGHVDLWIAMDCAPVVNEQGHILGGIVILEDVSEQKRAESRVRLAASVFSHAHEGILICDAKQAILDVNPTFTEITGYSREEILGRTPRFLASGRQEPEFYQGMWQAIAAEGYWEGEIWNRRKDGGIYPERLSISSVRDDNDRITHYIGTFSDISILKRHQAQLEHLAHYDPLTQLPNRALLSDRMRQALAQAKRAGTQVAICYLDLDGFKPINDEFGHDAGDALLIEVARRLRETVRAGDTVARLGGDEFVLLFLGIAGGDEAERAAVRVQRALTAPIAVKGQQRCISGSLGITLFPADDCDPDTLLRHADQAMYQAKQAGRNCYRLFDPGLDHQARNRGEMLDRVRQAIDGDEFLLHYQPIVDMRRGQVLAFEGLLRWQHPERGLLQPADFLPAIAGSEIDPLLGRWVLAEGLRQLAAWRAMGLTQALSLNVSASHLLAPAFVEELKTLLAAHPELEAHALQIEIMETAAIKDLERAIEVFAACREAGVDIALDDFGTGYSSLSYFRRLPVDALKIDQVFVQSVLASDEDLAVVESVVSLTKAFKRKLVAEGVESVEIGMLMLSLGCHVGQGYGIARPMPAEAIPAWTTGFVPDRNWSYPLTTFAREDMPLFLAELEHRAWIRRMGEWLDADSDQLSPPPLDARDCRFGQWHKGPGQARYGHFPAFAQIGDSHEAVHALGREVAQLYAEGHLAEARRHFADLAAESEELLEQLATLQAEIVVDKMQLQTT